MLGSAAATMHQDLNKNGCGINFTSDAAGVWNDQNGHGTHVLATISGTGTAKARFRGVATAVGSRERIRVGKIWKSTNTGQNSWLRDAIDYMADATSCDAPRPSVINLSGGASGSGQTGTDSESRKLDARVWETRQAYIVCSGNNGPGAQSIWSPGVAKNALTIGNVQDAGSSSVGELSGSSSRGPTGDNRMKPDLVATGAVVTSAQAGTTDGYMDKSGCSMATPHVSGIAATLLEHYPDFRNRPHLLRAHLMASAIAAFGRGQSGEQHRWRTQRLWARPRLRLSVALGAARPQWLERPLGLDDNHRQVLGLLRHRRASRSQAGRRGAYMGRARSERRSVTGGDLRC